MSAEIEVLDPAGSLELRTVKALERLATAVEQLALQAIPQGPETNAGRSDIAPWENAPIPEAAAAPVVYRVPVAAPPPGWICPVHHTVKVVPGGVSKRTGKPYNAFLSCTERDCQQKPPFA